LVTTWAAEGGRGAVAEHGEVLRDATPSRHGDPGTQYTSVFGWRCREMSVRTSMGSVGNAHQNAIAESFFASLEYELLGRRASEARPRPHAVCTYTSKGDIRHDVVTDRSTISRAGDSNVSPTHCIGPSTHDCMLTRRQALVDRGEQRDKQQQSESTPL
jgi:transposase InsO family protein